MTRSIRLSLGAVAVKAGMTSIFSDFGMIAVTCLKLERSLVLSNKTIDKDGYCSSVVAYGSSSSCNKPFSGMLKSYNAEDNFRGLIEFRIIDPSNLPEVGSSLSYDTFTIGERIDVVGNSIGKGFAGSMKRHNFSGLEATHGVSLSHRSHGSTGHRTEPGKVFKGKKMAGRMGSKRCSILNLKIIDIKDDILIVQGAVPGPRNGYVIVLPTVKGT